MSIIINALRNLFTVRQNSAAASQPRTQEGRRVNLSETRPKNRLEKFFSWFKGLFKRKDRNIASRTVTPNPNPTPIRAHSPFNFNPQQRFMPYTPALQSASQLERSVLENVYTETMPTGQKIIDKLLPMVRDANSYKVQEDAHSFKDLNVTRNYIQNYADKNIRFTNSEGETQDAYSLNLPQERPASYSDHLTEFCGGNQDQALRLSAVLTRDTFRIVSSAITGQPNCQWTEKNFEVSQEDNGQIKVQIKGVLRDPANNLINIQNITIEVPAARDTYPVGIEVVAFLEQKNTQEADIMPAQAGPMHMTDKIYSKLEPVVDLAHYYQRSNITEDYAKEFATNNIHFIESDGKMGDTSILKMPRVKLASYSDHLTAFCGGNKDQARRLSAVLTQKTLEIVSSAITGMENNRWPSKSFTVSKRANGDISAKIQGLITNGEGAIMVNSVDIKVAKLAGGIHLGVEDVDFSETQKRSAQNPNLRFPAATQVVPTAPPIEGPIPHPRAAPQVVPTAPLAATQEEQFQMDTDAMIAATQAKQEVPPATTPAELTLRLSALCGNMAGAQAGSPLDLAWPERATGGAAPPLNIVNDYINNYAEVDKTFIQESGQKENSKNLYARFGQKNQEASDHLTQFCGNNANQAQRLSALLSLQAASEIARGTRNVAATIARNVGSGEVQISFMGMNRNTEGEIQSIHAEVRLPAAANTRPIVDQLYRQAIV